jgi:hypothetical protein
MRFFRSSRSDSLSHAIDDTELRDASDLYSSYLAQLTAAVVRLSAYESSAAKAFESLRSGPSRPGDASTFHDQVVACQGHAAILSSEIRDIIDKHVAPLKAELQTIDSVRARATKAHHRVRQLELMGVQGAGHWAADSRAELAEAKPRFLELMGAFTIRFEAVRTEVAGRLWNCQSDFVDDLLQVFGQGAPPPATAMYDFSEIDGMIQRAKAKEEPPTGV